MALPSKLTNVETCPRENGGSFDYVILLHGLGRTKSSMKKIEKFLLNKGYTVFNFGYVSRKYNIEEISEQLDYFLKERCNDPNKSIHFVTHSLGGIVVRYYLNTHSLQQLGRVVMIAPPNKGSEIADWLKKNIFFKLLNGPAGQQLLTSPESIPNILSKVNFELGVIAGDKSNNPIFSAIIPGKDDGKVSIESAKVEEMKDFLIVHKSHTFIMRDAKVLAQIHYFLQNGHFKT